MAAKIVWTDKALADLADAVEWIRADNPASAIEVGQGMMKSIEMLASFPRLARQSAFRQGVEIRELVHPPYRIFHTLSPDASIVTILHVWHSRRDEPEPSSPAH
jgi:plasmid stabilization system protein ParE